MSDNLMLLMRKISKLGMTTMIVQRTSDDGVSPILYHRAYIEFAYKKIKYKVHGDDVKQIGALFRAISRLPPEFKQKIKDSSNE